MNNRGAMVTQIGSIPFSREAVIAICSLPDTVVSRRVKQDLVNLGVILMNRGEASGGTEGAREFLKSCNQAMAGKYTVGQQKVIQQYKDRLGFLLDHAANKVFTNRSHSEQITGEEFMAELTELLEMIRIDPKRNLSNAQLKQALLSQLQNGLLDDQIRCNLNIDQYLEWEDLHDKSKSV